jgi:hypothetical protein
MNDHPAPEPAMDDAERELRDVEREFPRWHCWKGVSGLVYARLPLTSPPMVARAENPAGLIAAIYAEIGRRSR